MKWISLLLLVLRVTSVSGQDFCAIIRQLDSIRYNDQRYREEIEQVRQTNQDNPDALTKTLTDLSDIMSVADSVNMVKVSRIIAQYGWLGAGVIGKKANATLFLVVQHAVPDTQYKYLPILREAVANGRAQMEDLAMLEDRVALHRGKRQTYGSQIGWDTETNTYYVLPLADPEHADDRRKQAGLEPMQQYLDFWNIKWDPIAYKKILPQLDAINNIH